jgi:Family of unknown function (DUF6084)
MPDLSFQLEGVEAVAHAATPLLTLKLRITNLPPEQAIHSIHLRCQVQIEPGRRRYAATEQENLRDLFGAPELWGRTVRPLLWMNTSVLVPGFAASTLVDLELPCTFDFNIAATKYFHALESGEIPVEVLFSGTVFYSANDDRLQVAQIPWDREAHYRIPVSVWKQMMDMYHPNVAWVCLSRDVFESLNRYKVQHGIPTFEKALESLLPVSEREEVKSA